MKTLNPCTVTALDATALCCYLDDQQPKNPNSSETISHLIEYIRDLILNHHRVIVPAVTVCEYLAFYGDQDIANQAATVLSRGLFVASFDGECAKKAAEIWSKHCGPSMRKKMNKDFDISKQCVKTDIQIIATSMCYGAETLITDDKGIISICQAIGYQAVKPCDLPRPQRQASLFN